MNRKDNPFYLSIRGVKLKVYDSQREKSYENNITLIFLHGSPGQISNWKYQIKYFKEYYRTIAFDQRGYGESDKPKRAPLDDYIKDLEQLMKTLNVQEDTAILVGHSFGGVVAQEYAVDHKIKGLVLIGSLPRFKPDIFDKIIWYLPSFIWKPILFTVNPLTLKLYKTVYFSPNVDEKIYLEFMDDNKEYIEGLPSHVFRYLKELKGYDATSRLEKINIPTLIIVGKYDQVTPVSYSEEIHKHIPNSTLKIIDDAGHMVIYEKANEVNELIHKYIESL